MATKYITFYKDLAHNSPILIDINRIESVEIVSGTEICITMQSGDNHTIDTPFYNLVAMLETNELNPEKICKLSKN